MQCAIDNAKRKYDIDLPKEITAIKQDMDIKTHGYPAFWSVIRRGFDRQKINHNLVCPMNYIFDIKVEKARNKEATIPTSDFFVKHELTEHRRKCKRVEEVIQKYSLKLYTTYQKPLNDKTAEEDKSDTYFLLRADFEDLIKDIQQIYISKNYLGLMSWLINRAFRIGSGVKSKDKSIQSTINHNKAILLKTLYTVNSSALLQCFTKNIKKVVND